MIPQEFHMRIDRLGIAMGGEHRLRRAIEARVRQKHQKELAACASSSEKAALREKIHREIEEEMKRVASPYSVWSS